MCEEKYIPLYRFFGTIFAPILYFITFSVDSVNWVEDTEFTWGFWKRINSSEIIHGGQTIAPGDSPDYFEAVRVLACFILILFILFFFTFDPNKGLGEGQKPVNLALFTVFLLTIVLGLVGGYYKDDKRWKERDPRLGWCFYVALSADIIAFLTSILMMIQARINAKAKAAKVAPKAKPKPQPTLQPKPKPKPKPDPKPEKKPDPKPVTPPPKPDPKPAVLPPITPPASRGQSATSRKSTSNDENKGERTGATSNDLSPYAIPADPGVATPEIPDYHVAVEEGRGHSPPPVALSTSSRWRRSMNFLKNYAKTAVGMGKAYERK